MRDLQSGEQRRAGGECWLRLAVFALGLFVLLTSLPAPAQEGTYQQGRQAMNAGRTEEAIHAFCSLGQYRDAAAMCGRLRAQLENLNRTNETNFQSGVRAFQSGNFEQARQYFDQVTGPRYDEAQNFLNVKIPAAMKAGKPAGEQAAQPLTALPSTKDTAKAKTAGRAAAVKPTITAKPAESANPSGAAPAVATSTETPPPVAADAESVLVEALRDYYSARFSDAESKLQQYISGRGQRTGLANFYLGASRLTRFYLAGARNEDTALFAEARNAFKLASKVQGFVVPQQYVSPRILEVYRGVTQ